jgi:hypothetical protein
MTVFGASEARVTDDANLIEDLGTDSLDVIAATDFVTVGGWSSFIERQVAAAETRTKILPNSLGIRLYDAVVRPRTLSGV